MSGYCMECGNVQCVCDEIIKDPEVPTCKTCKWWDTVEIAEHFRRHRACHSPKLMPPDDAEYGTDTLLYYDEGSKFWSGPDFGCVHHEDKEPSNE